MSEDFFSGESSACLKSFGPIASNWALRLKVSLLKYNLLSACQVLITTHCNIYVPIGLRTF